MTTIKDELKRMIIETAYSSKGHFKTADWMGLSLATYIVIPTVTSLLQVFYVFPDFIDRSLSFLGFLFSFLALSSVWANNRNEADRSIEMHVNLGNKYLAIHKEIRVLLADINNINTGILSDLQTRISEIDQKTSKCKINFAGRWWAKFRIKEEMDLNWVDSI